MLKKIISGGQRGADQGGLFAAKMLGLETGGTAPKTYRVCLFDGSDGSDREILEALGLTEHASYQYPPRTKQNVVDSDGTLWVGYEHSPGGKLTIKTAKECNKPLIVNPTPENLRQWLTDNSISILNVAGNRCSPDNPNIQGETMELILKAMGWGGQ